MVAINRPVTVKQSTSVRPSASAHPRRKGLRPHDTRTYMSTGAHKPNGDPEEATLWGGSSRR